VFCVVALFLTAGRGLAQSGNGKPHVSQGTAAAWSIPIDGAIGPAISTFVVNEIHGAAKADVPVIILRLDTPGGLSSAMRDIIKAVLASPVPIVGYVGPSGARAASAGTYILYSTSIAAMAPATNLGAATPVQIGGGNEPTTPNPKSSDSSSHKDGNDASNAKSSDKPGQNSTSDQKSNDNLDLGNGATERRKAVNDAVAYIRSLAERSGRNADWAEKAVHSAASLTAKEALRKNVINLIAANQADLLKQVDGRDIQTANGSVTLHTRDLSIEQRQPDWRTQFLALVTDPTVAYLLFMVGIVGLAAEALNPGAVLPGVVGGIALLTALFAFQVLPINYSGLLLILLGLALVVAEAFVPSFGALGLGGIAAFVFGSIMLMDNDLAGYDISIGIIIGIALGAIAILGMLLWMFARSRKAHVETGHAGLIGRPCVALRDFEREGRVWLHGESWLAVSEVPVLSNQPLIVTGARGLTVFVRPDTDTSQPHPVGSPPTRS
jgi:membrane-bound serine protease (ClpP class)